MTHSSPSKGSDPFLNSVIAGYRLLQLAGKGGMGSVYFAREESSGKTYAFKILKPELASNENQVRRFMREARIIKSLDHPHIIRIRAAGEADGVFYLVMEFISGWTLVDLIRNQWIKSVDNAVQIAEQIALALAAAHEHGVIHRDVKPHNIMMTKDMRVRLTDFGLAKETSSETTSLTSTGNILGTPIYMAPEQWRGEPPTPQTDIYALGVVLYEMLTGRPPFKSDTPHSLMLHALHDQLPPPSNINPEADSALDKIIYDMTAIDPAKRYKSASALADDLRAYCDGTLHSDHSGFMIDSAVIRELAGMPENSASVDPAPSADKQKLLAEQQKKQLDEQKRLTDEKKHLAAERKRQDKELKRQAKTRRKKNAMHVAPVPAKARKPGTIAGLVRPLATRKRHVAFVSVALVLVLVAASRVPATIAYFRNKEGPPLTALAYVKPDLSLFVPIYKADIENAGVSAYFDTLDTVWIVPAKTPFHHNGPVYVARFDPVHHLLVSGAWDGSVIAWNLDPPLSMLRWQGHTDVLLEIEPSPDFTHWLTSSYDGKYMIWSVDRRDPVATIPNGIPSRSDADKRSYNTRVAASIFVPKHFSRDGKRIALATTNGGINVVDSQTYQVLQHFGEGANWAFVCYFSPTGKHIITGGFGDPRFRLWDAKTVTELFPLTSVNGGLTCEITPDEKTLITANGGTDVTLWNMATGHEIRRIKTRSDNVFTSRLSSGGKILLTCGGNVAELWDADTGKLMAACEGHEGWVMTARFNPKEDRILTASTDNTMRLWTLDGKQLVSIKFEEAILFADWSPDGKQIVVTLWNGNVYLLDSVPWDTLSKYGEANTHLDDRARSWRASQH